jgi:hypothetical protein
MMTTWDDQFDKHPVHEALAQFRTAIALSHEMIERRAITDSQVMDGLAKLQAAAEWIEAALNACDKVLATAGQLKGIQGHLQNSLNELNNFNGNQAVGHVVNACNQIDGAITSARQLPRPENGDDAEAMAKGASEFRKLLARLRAGMETERNTLQTGLDELRREIAEAASEVQGQKRRLDSALTEHQQAFEKAQESRRIAAEEALSKAHHKYVEAEDRRAKSHDQALQAIRAKEQDALSAISVLKEKAEKLVQAIGSAGMTSGYKAVANRMARHALAWQLGAVVAVIAFVAFGAVYVLPHVNGDSAWTLVLVRLFMSLPLLLLAGFCVAQVRHFHRLEEANREMELQLASLDPFVATLPDPQQLKIKEQAVPRFFPGHYGRRSRTVEESDS